MEGIAVPSPVFLTWADFSWLDEPTPAPPDVVIEAPADPLLSVICEGDFISDMAIPQVVMPLFDKRTSTTDSLGSISMGAGLCTGKKLVPRKGAG